MLSHPACLAGQPVDAGAPNRLTLAAAVARALAVDPGVRAAAAQVESARAAVAAADSQRKFQLSFQSTGGGANADVYQPPPEHETFGTLQDQVTVPIPVGARPGLQARSAREQLDASQSQYRAARLTLAGAVVSAFFDLLRKQALLQLAEQQLDLANTQLNDAKERNGAGDAAALDVLQAKTPVAAAQASVAMAKTAFSVATETLNDLIGAPLDQSIAPIDSTGTRNAPAYGIDDARKMAEAISPEVMAADATVRASEDALSAARRYRDPSVSFQAIDARSGDQTSFSREDVLQAQITVPLSDGGLGDSQVRAAAAELEHASAQADAARKSARAAAGAAYLNADGTAAELASAKDASDIAATTYDRTLEGYRNGLFPLVDVLTAQNALAQASTLYVQSLYDSENAAFTLDLVVRGEAAIPSDVDGEGREWK
jgi:outer membrane protein TolC